MKLLLPENLALKLFIKVNYFHQYGFICRLPTNTIPDLAISGTSSQITTSSSGKYVYAIWNENEAGHIQTAFSHDFGQTWQDPNHTPTNTISNLASLGFNPQITTNSTGQYI